MSFKNKKYLAFGIVAVVAISILPVFMVEGIGASTYTGYVRDRNGRAISSALVTLYSGGMQVSTDYTDSNGYYCVGDFAVSGPYIRVTKTKWVSQTRSVSSVGGTYNFNLYTSSCALIVAGSSDERFNHDAHDMYNTLIDHYSFSASRIYLITELASYDGINIPRDRAVSQTNVEWACDQIDAATSTSDDVIVFWTGHGIKHPKFWFWETTYYTLDCGADEMTRSELDSALDGIPCSKMLVMIGSCYSGYFIGGGMDNNANRAILTACSSTEYSWGYEYTSGAAGHCYFDYGIIKALDPDLNAGTADANSNDRVSIQEFFDYAKDYVDAQEPFDDDGTDVYQTPQSWKGSSFGTLGYRYIGDQYF